MTSNTAYINKDVELPLIHFLWLALLVILLSSCSSSSESQHLQSNSVDNAKAMKIASALYFDQRTPTDFYKENFQNDKFHITSHVKNTDLLPISSRQGLTSYELSSNDFVEAMNWSEQSVVLQTSYKQLVDTTETLLYYQFTRVDPTAPQFIHLNRVLKANALDRNGVDSSYKGRITLVNMTVSDVKYIVEYLWTFTMNNNYGNAVLSSSITESSTEFVYFMQQASLNSNFSGSCDAIDVYDVRYTVSKASGFIRKSETLNQTIKARRTGDNLEICGP